MTNLSFNFDLQADKKELTDKLTDQSTGVLDTPAYAPPTPTAAKRPMDEKQVRMASDNQKKALAHTRDIWISANAGTGKTEVLTRRLLVLLIGDPTCAPKNILALTFTKAGASEMAARLPRKLAEWAALPDSALVEKLQQDLGLATTEQLASQQCARVRALASMVHTEPPTMATIHGFCQHMLKQFPQESGIPLGSRVLEDDDQKRLLQQAMNVALNHSDAPTARAIDLLMEQIGEYNWRELTDMTAKQWVRLRKSVETPERLAAVMEALRIAMDLPDDWRTLEPKPDLPLPHEIEAVRALVDQPRNGDDAKAVLAAASANDREKLAEKWRGLLMLPNPAKDRNKAFLSFNERWGRKSLVNKETEKKFPGTTAVLSDAMARLLAGEKLRGACEGLRLTEAMLQWAAAVRASYTDLKQRDGWMDFQDLLDAAEKLLADGDEGFQEWIFYKLDRRYRHILIDEAQDNNQQQAELVAVLATSIVEAMGADGLMRTVLAVGDMKQSVYRFQGARPEYFLAMRTALQNREQMTPESLSGKGFSEINLTTSFRTCQTVLDVVDTLFSPPELATAVQVGLENAGESSDWPRHTSAFAGQYGCVEVWPLAVYQPKKVAAQRIDSTDDDDDVPGWVMPTERVLPLDEVSQCARTIARRIKQAIASQLILPSIGRPVKQEDFLILTRTNKPLIKIARVLREAGLTVSGQAMTLETPALQDLYALLRVLHSPEDNIALATVLKSPLMSWNDHKLWQLANHEHLQHGGKYVFGSAWWPALAALDNDAFNRLDDLRLQAALLSPAALVDRLVKLFDMPERYAKLSNNKTADNSAEKEGLIEAFDDVVLLAHDCLTLTALIDRLDKGIEVGGQRGGGVRLRTAHKSKGLEAPIVILAETTGDLDKVMDKLAWPVLTIGGKQHDIGVLYRMSHATPDLQHEADLMEKRRAWVDSLRLLYVAMTRAKDCLWVTGWETTKSFKQDKPCWYSLIKNALTDYAQTNQLALTEAEPGQLVLEQGDDPALNPGAWALKNHTEPPAPLQVATRAPISWPLFMPLATNNDEQHNGLTNDVVNKQRQQQAMARGDAIHAGLASGFAAMEAVLDQPSDDQTIGSTISRVKQALPELFGANSRAEVEVVLTDGSLGRIDRLISLPDALWIIDFKTNKHVPQEIPPAYVAQLNSYAAALAPIAHGKTIKCAIVWTDARDANNIAKPRLQWLA